MTLWGAVKRAIRRCFVFSGRATRPEFWWWALVVVGAMLTVFALGLLEPLIHGYSVRPIGWAMAWSFLLSSVIVELVTSLPTLAVAVRRLHDTGRSGWWALLWLLAPIPVWTLAAVSFLDVLGMSLGGGDPSLLSYYILLGLALAATTGTVVWAVKWLSRPGDDGPNRFGADPLK